MGGCGLTRLIDEPSRGSRAARVNARGPPGPYALAASAAMAVECIAGRSRRMICGFVSPDQTEGAGRKARTGAMPVPVS